MILLINGPFGIGKSTVADSVVRRHEGTLLYDPELVGAFARRLATGVEDASDFQELAIWPLAVVANAGALKDAYHRDLVVPMCIWRLDRFQAISEGLRRIDPRLICVRLTATEETVRRRILGRAEADGPHEWCLSHLGRGLAAANDPRFGLEVATEGQSPEQVASAVIELLKGR